MIEDRQSKAQSNREKLKQIKFDIPPDRVHQTKPQPPSSSVASKQPAARIADYQTVKANLHERLIDALNTSDLLSESEEVLEEFVEAFVDARLDEESLPLNEEEQRRIVDDLKEETLGVGPLAPLMADPAVTDILVNRYDQVYIERFGKLERTKVSDPVLSR